MLRLDGVALSLNKLFWLICGDLLLGCGVCGKHVYQAQFVLLAPIVFDVHVVPIEDELYLRVDRNWKALLARLELYVIALVQIILRLNEVIVYVDAVLGRLLPELAGLAGKVILCHPLQNAALPVGVRDLGLGTNGHKK